MLKNSSTINYKKLNKFFSELIDLNSLPSLEEYIYHKIGSEFIKETDRLKIILKSACTSISTANSSTSGHPSRILMTRLMRIMKECDPDKVLFWMNHLQSFEKYRVEMQRAYRFSGSYPKESWQTSCFNFYHMPTGPNQKWTTTKAIIFLPSKPVLEAHSDLDLHNPSVWSNIPARRTKFGLPAFCMYLNLDKFHNCLLQEVPKG